jgi:hypothetical protein
VEERLYASPFFYYRELMKQVYEEDFNIKREQQLDIQGDGKLITLTNRITIDPILEENYFERMENPRGFTKEKTMRKVASIPIEHLMRDPDGIIFVNLPTGSPEAKIALRKFLSKYPGYKASEGSI